MIYLILASETHKAKTKTFSSLFITQMTNYVDQQQTIVVSSSTTTTTNNNNNNKISSSSSLLQNVSEQWINELRQAAEDLSIVATQLQNKFTTANKTAMEYGKEPIPDLVDMIQRIQLLSIAITNIQKACKELAIRRKAIIPKIIHQLINQQQAIDELLDKTQISILSSEDEQQEKEIIEKTFLLQMLDEK